MGSPSFPQTLFVSHDAELCRNEIARVLAVAGLGEVNDLFFEALLMARKHRWSWECACKLFEVLQKLVNWERDHPLSTMHQSFAKFKELVLMWSCERPPWTAGLFDEDQVIQINTFILSHHYAHFGMHKFLISPANLKLELETQS